MLFFKRGIEIPLSSKAGVGSTLEKNRKNGGCWMEYI